MPLVASHMSALMWRLAWRLIDLACVAPRTETSHSRWSKAHQFPSIAINLHQLSPSFHFAFVVVIPFSMGSSTCSSMNHQFSSLGSRIWA